ncbi:hypothetical protein [Sedimentisphaera salicampi]|uniref:Putative iron-only hydrogenase system regulator n=1 Tax=Sedimentisphaera salicampi TaxID=1941349 RepID=A0A1W6LL68_9BACT|nr:hypothetical protein [Sedimentisphaera salicampi]ARN56492.1 putative iron-only hydrogenase system regulator [Sedimentisphaera salicampi]OXU15375.1 putative iron-only hydrogenase system regulator [Sedimentisphaera salicampi]
MDRHLILGVHVTERLKHAQAIQEVLTNFGDTIKTRIGLHDVNGEISSPNGVLLLECIDKQDRFSSLKQDLSNIEGVEIKEIVFDH